MTPDGTVGREQIGYVQKARWDEWEARCNVPRCGWNHSQGNRSREDAENRLRGHAGMVHPPLIPVYRTTPPEVRNAE